VPWALNRVEWKKMIHVAEAEAKVAAKPKILDKGFVVLVIRPFSFIKRRIYS